MKIGNLEVEKYILAPMAGVNCAAFRVLCKRRGASLVYTDVIGADEFAMYIKTNSMEQAILKYVNPQEEEKPLAVQLAGSNLNNLSVAIDALNKVADVIDFNIGCPLKEVLAKKAGAYLMKHTDQLYKILKLVRSEAKVPLTLKMRSGWKDENALEICKEAETIGVDAIIIHPRTLKQGYKGKANWKLVEKIKDSIKIPVILSGDVVNTELAKKAFEITRCDAIMVGRAARVNPSIFKHLSEEKKGHSKIYSKITEEVRVDFKEFLELYKHTEYKYKISQVRDHALWLATECKGNKYVTQKILACEDEKSLIKIFNEIEF